MSAAWDAIVIGAGVNGLAAAATLARAGRRTLVLERGDTTDGSGASFEFAPGFRATPFGMDAGWLPPAVARALNLGARADAADPAGPVSARSAGNTAGAGPGAAFMHIQPRFGVAVEPGRILTLPTAPGRADGLAPFSERDAAAWPRFVERLRAISGFLESLYQEPAPDLDATGVGELMSLGRLGLRFRRLGRDGMIDLLRTLPMSVETLLDDTFESDGLKAALAAVAVRGSRHGPRAGGTAFTLLHNLIGAGTTPVPAWAGRYRAGGPDALAAAVEAAARRHGATIRTGARVTRIEIRDYAVKGVVLEDGEEIGADVVLSNADPTRTLLGMVEPAWLDPGFVHAVRNIRYRGCTAFVLYALDALPELPGEADPAAALEGIVSLTPEMTGLERAADAVKYRRLPEQPHVEITAPSVRWPGFAPDGRHVVMARVLYGAGARAGADARVRGAGGSSPVGDSGADAGAGSELAERVSRAIACVSPRFADRVLHRVVLSPGEIEDRYGWTEGAASQGELALDQILFMRPVPGWSRYAMPIDGLYLCGAGTHPGPGVTGGPGWLAAQEVLRRGSDRRRSPG